MALLDVLCRPLSYGEGHINALDVNTHVPAANRWQEKNNTSRKKRLPKKGGKGSHLRAALTVSDVGTERSAISARRKR